MAEYQERVGRRIREAREAKDWSQAKLAHAIGPTKKGQPRDASTISRYERGKVMPGSDTLEAIARVLDVDVAYFMAAEPKAGVADLMTSLNGDGESQLARIEAKLDEALTRLRALEAAVELVGVEARRTPRSTGARVVPAATAKRSRKTA